MAKENVLDLHSDLWFNKFMEDAEEIKTHYKDIPLELGAAKEICWLVRIKNLEKKFQEFVKIMEAVKGHLEDNKGPTNDR